MKRSENWRKEKIIKDLTKLCDCGGSIFEVLGVETLDNGLRKINLRCGTCRKEINLEDTGIQKEIIAENLAKKHPIGQRVGAILDSGENGTVRFFGYGVLEGYEIPPDDAGGMAEIARDEGMVNPKIRLDNGKVVWGCECWWGTEAEIRESLTRFPNIVEVDIDEMRNELQFDEDSD